MRRESVKREHYRRGRHSCLSESETEKNVCSTGSTPARKQPPPAFTLIEMLVVLALAAILGAIVTVSLFGSFRTARAEDVAGRIAEYDQLAREYCRRFGKPGRLVFDLGRGTVTRSAEDAGELSRDTGGAPLHLPAGFRFRGMFTAGAATTGGQASISCSADGQTPSYAIGLADAGGGQYWMGTAGLTGRMIKVRDEQEVRDIFRALDSAATPAKSDDAR
jgi:prepilin-type N-terminal cleavage/methylation domain-containing protein